MPPLLAALVILGAALRLPSVYPPGLEYDAATVALQACQILDGDRPLFWTGQGYMGTAGAYLVAGLFALFGKNTLVLSVLAWALSGLWILASVLLALRLYGDTAATVTALFWLVPSQLFMYWSSAARTDRLGLFILTPVLLLLTHAAIRRFREGRAVARRILGLGLLAGFSFWHNMAIGPCLLVCFGVLWLHLGSARHRRLLWVFLAAALLALSPVLLFHARSGLGFARQVGAGTFQHLPEIARSLVTDALPAFWGMRTRGPAAPGHPAVRWTVVAWVSLLFVIFLGQVVRRWRAGEDLLADQLVLGTILIHPLVLALSSFGATVAGRSPLLYLLSLYGVAFVVPGAAVARCPRPVRLLLLLPLAIFMGNNAAGAVPRARAFLEACSRRGREAIERFPDPHDRLIAFLGEQGLTRGHVAGHRGKYVNLRGLDRVRVSQAYEEQYLPYALAVDSAARIFWIDPDTDLEEAFEAVGCRFERRQVGRDRVYYDFRREQGAGIPIEEGIAAAAFPNGAQAPYLLDRRIDTVWEMPAGPAEAAVTLELLRPEHVARVTLVPRDHRSLPSRVTVEASSDGAAWRTLTRLDAASASFWSVRRPMLKIVKPRCEIALPAAAASRYVRLSFPAPRRAGALAEVYLYRTAAAPAAERIDEALEGVVAAIEPQRTALTVVGDHHLMGLFAERGFRVEFLPNRFVDNYGRENPALSAVVPLDISRPLALVVEEGHLGAVSDRLREGGIRFRRRSFPGFGLLLTEPSRSPAGLYWSGFDLLRLASGRTSGQP